VADKREKKQHVRTFYLPFSPGAAEREGKPGKVVALPFASGKPSEEELHRFVRTLTSDALRTLAGIATYDDLEEKASAAGTKPAAWLKRRLERAMHETPSTDARAALVEEAPSFPRGVDPSVEDPLPFMRWLVETWAPDPGSGRMLDPFAGTGNAPIAAAEAGFDALYCEIDPLYRFFAEAKIDAVTRTAAGRARIARELSMLGRSLRNAIGNTPPSEHLRLTYAGRFRRDPLPDEMLDLLLRARTVADQLQAGNEIVGRLFTSSVLGAIARLERRSRPESLSPGKFVRELASDLEKAEEFVGSAARELPSKPRLVALDAADLRDLPHLGVSFVLTSLPAPGTDRNEPAVARWFLGLPPPVHGRTRVHYQTAPPDVTGLPAPLRSNLTEIHQIIAGLAAASPDAAATAAAWFDDMTAIVAAVVAHLTPGARLVVDARDVVFRGELVRIPRLVERLLSFLGFSLAGQQVVSTRKGREGETLERVVALSERFPPS
jgi:hypothetical protein